MKKPSASLVLLFLLLLAAAAQPVLPGKEYPQDLVQLYDQALDHLLGRGRTVDLAEAARLLRLAADRGHAEAQYNLGNAYANGEGVPVDYAETARWLSAAAEQGHEKAKANLGNRDFWTKAAASGDSEALYRLGNAYVQFPPVDHRRAVSSWKAAADKGHVGARYNLGLAYLNGMGVKKDHSETFRLWSAAAEAGHLKAQAGLALLYYEGWGVQKSSSEYLRWITRAAKGGDLESQYNLGMSYLKGEGSPKDPGKALHWLLSAANHGHVDASFNLGALALETSKGLSDAKLASDLLMLSYQFFIVASELDPDTAKKADALKAAGKVAALMSSAELVAAKGKAADTLKAIAGK